MFLNVYLLNCLGRGLLKCFPFTFSRATRTQAIHYSKEINFYYYPSSKFRQPHKIYVFKNPVHDQGRERRMFSLRSVC